MSIDKKAGNNEMKTANVGWLSDEWDSPVCNTNITATSYEHHCVSNHRKIDCFFNVVWSNHVENTNAPHHWSFVSGNHRLSVDSPHKGPVMWKHFDVITWLINMLCIHCVCIFGMGWPGTWRRHLMETFSALLAFCAGNSPVTGEFPSQRPVTRSFDVFFDRSLNKRLSKQSWGWCFITPSRPLWRHCNDRTALLTNRNLNSMEILRTMLLKAFSRTKILEF